MTLPCRPAGSQIVLRVHPATRTGRRVLLKWFLPLRVFLAFHCPPPGTNYHTLHASIQISPFATPKPHNHNLAVYIISHITIPLAFPNDTSQKGLVIESTLKGTLYFDRFNIIPLISYEITLGHDVPLLFGQKTVHVGCEWL